MHVIFLFLVLMYLFKVYSFTLHQKWSQIASWPLNLPSKYDLVLGTIA